MTDDKEHIVEHALSDIRYAGLYAFQERQQLLLQAVLNPLCFLSL